MRGHAFSKYEHEGTGRKKLKSDTQSHLPFMLGKCSTWNILCIIADNLWFSRKIEFLGSLLSLLSLPPAKKTYFTANPPAPSGADSTIFQSERAFP